MVFRWLSKRKVAESLSSQSEEEFQSGGHEHPDLTYAREMEKAGKLNDAEALYLDILDQEPDSAEALLHLGLIYKRRGDYSRACEYLNHAVEAQPSYAEPHYELGRIYELQNEQEEAIYSFEMAIHYSAEFSEAYSRIVDIYKDLDQADKALEVCQKWVDICSSDAEAHYKLGVLYKDQRDFQSCIAALRKSVEFNPTLSDGWARLGHALFMMEEYEEAKSPLELAIRLNPADLSSHNNLGCVFRYLGDFDKALQCFDHILKLEPNNFWARWSKSHVLLAQGKFRNGWFEYEARFKSEAVPYRPLPFKPWQGEALSDKTILVFAEQGLGDEIMFASCLPDIIAQAKHCIIECEPRLEKLYRLSFPSAQVFPCLQERVPSWLKEVPPIDAQVPAGSLPRYLRNEWSDFPSHQGYIKADPERIAFWRARLARLGSGLKIGISWRGGTVKTCTIGRSISLEAMKPILQMPGIQFVSLQYGKVQEELRSFTADYGIQIEHWQEAIDDYGETAALVSALDLVITVCTSIVHLSGALDHKAWVMTPAIPEWRYMQVGDKMPWYGSVRLFRQSESGNWKSVIDGICEELQDLANHYAK